MTFRLAFLLVSILILSNVDTIFTMWILQGGGTEENPIILALMEIHPWLFITVKTFVTLGGLLVLYRYHYHLVFKIPVAYCIGFLFAAYLSLITYELYLLHLIYGK